jgi:hypothetical protein
MKAGQRKSLISPKSHLSSVKRRLGSRTSVFGREQLPLSLVDLKTIFTQTILECPQTNSELLGRLALLIRQAQARFRVNRLNPPLVHQTGHPLGIDRVALLPLDSGSYGVDRNRASACRARLKAASIPGSPGFPGRLDHRNWSGSAPPAGLAG